MKFPGVLFYVIFFFIILINISAGGVWATRKNSRTIRGEGGGNVYLLMVFDRMRNAADVGKNVQRYPCFICKINIIDLYTHTRDESTSERKKYTVVDNGIKTERLGGNIRDFPRNKFPIRT